MSLNTLTFSGIVTRGAAAIQSSVTAVLNLDVGSVLRAILEAVAGVALWLQGLVVTLLQRTRLATSTGDDVESFVADFGLNPPRIAAIGSTGSVTFSRFTATNAAKIPVGQQVQSTDGTQTFSVIADTNQAAYDATQNAYLVAAGTSLVSATVQAVTKGASSNVLANTITVITAPITGIDTVNNPSAMTGGQDAEKDDAVKARFHLYLSGLREGIQASVDSAIANLQLGIQHKTVENEAYTGGAQLGYFYVIIAPYSTANQQAVYAAVDAVRPMSVTFGVFAATQLTANVVMTATPLPGYSHTQIAAVINTAITDYIGTIPMGSTLYWSKLYAIAYSVAGVDEVTGMTLNGVTADLVPTSAQAIIAGTVTVN